MCSRHSLLKKDVLEQGQRGQLQRRQRALLLLGAGAVAFFLHL